MQLSDEIVTRATLGRRNGSDQFKIVCPSCADLRTPANRRERTCSINYHADRIVYRCWHCNINGIVPLRERDRSNVHPMQVVPLRSAPERATSEALEWLERERGIPRAVAERFGVASGTRFVRKLAAEVACVGFTYGNDAGQPYAVKWRAMQAKGFSQDGAAQTLYLAEHIEPGADLIITEGEIDALSFWAAGLPAVSIPSGGVEAGASDDNSKLRWTRHHEKLLTAAPRIFIASDGDVIGETTAQELARRLGKAKCFRLTYPPGCKDGNDALRQHGTAALHQMVAAAQPWPLEGVSTVSDLTDRVLSIYEKGLPPGLSTGVLEIDKFFTVAMGNLMVLTGIPSSGKSTWLDDILVRMMSQHDTRVAWCSFENPSEIHIAKLLTQRTGKPFGHGRTERMTQDELKLEMAWLNERAVFVQAEEMLTPKEIVARFEACILRFGVTVCVVDPFNFVRLNGRDGGADTDAINDMLSEFKMFAKRSGVAFFIVAHPAKPMGQSSDWVPTGYSISGSAHWYNRADFGLTMHRRKDGPNELHVWKARFAHQGQQGMVELQYDPVSYRFNPVTEAAAPHWTEADDPF